MLIQGYKRTNILKLNHYTGIQSDSIIKIIFYNVENPIVLKFFLKGPFINPELWFLSLCFKLQLHVYTYMPNRLLETMGSRLKVLKLKTEDL